MMLRNAVRLLAAVALCARVLDAQSLFLARTAPSVIERAVILPAGEFSRARVEQLAQPFLDEHAGVKVLKFLVFTDEADAGDTLWGQYSEMTIAHVRAIITKKKRGAMAEVLRLGDGTVLRSRTPTGRIERVVLRGSDPLRMELLGDAFEIRYVAFDGPTENGQAKTSFTDSEAVVTFLVAASGAALAPEPARRLTEVLQSFLPSVKIGIRLREDDWFVGMGLPYLLPFARATTAPSDKEYFQSPEVTCYTTPQRGIDCRRLR
jgi:hypothetical protein